MGQKIKKRWFWRKKAAARGIAIQENKYIDILERAAKTFLEAFIASIPIDAAMLASGWNVWRATLLSAVAAGISAVMNLILAKLRKENEYGDIRTASDETGERK